MKKILNGSGKDKLEKMLLVAHCCILQHLFLRHHDHKNALMMSMDITGHHEELTVANVPVSYVG